MASFPNYQGQLLTIDDPRQDPQNPSCLRNQSGNVTTRWVYDGSSQSIKSSITLLANTFVSSNRTYQWKVQLTNKRNALQQTAGYVLVHIEDASRPIIIIGFVWTNLDHFDRETAVDLLVVSFKRCVSRIWNISWLIRRLKWPSTHSVFERAQRCRVSPGTFIKA